MADGLLNYVLGLIKPVELPLIKPDPGAEFARRFPEMPPEQAAAFQRLIAGQRSTQAQVGGRMLEAERGMRESILDMHERGLRMVPATESKRLAQQQGAPELNESGGMMSPGARQDVDRVPFSEAMARPIVRPLGAGKRKKLVDESIGALIERAGQR